MISLDTTRADHFGFMGAGWIRTPRIDAFAAEGIVFTDCLTAAPTTLASNASLLTGTYPHRHGVPRNGFVLDEANLTLAEILQKEGFSTAGFAAAFALENRFGIDQGFQHWDDEFTIMAEETDAKQDQRRAGEVNASVLRWLDGSWKGEPLFLFVHYFDPHAPYDPPGRWATEWEPADGGGPAPPWSEAPDEESRELARKYAGEVSYMDAQLGELLDELGRRGLLDQAIVTITSDHGETFWEHPEQFNHGREVYQTTTRSVCLVRLPGGRDGGRRIDQLVGTIDLMPTMLTQLGLKVPRGLDGESVPLDGTGFVPRVRFSQATKPHHKAAESGLGWPNRRKAGCVRQGDYKLIETPMARTRELFNLAEDPGEQRNLLDEPGPDSEEIARRLGRILEDWVDSADPFKIEFSPTDRDETIRKLKSLGYLGGDDGGI